MISHVVLLKPRPDLSAEGRERLIAAFEQAIAAIAVIRSVRVGSRIVHGAAYEAGMPNAADYMVLLDFDDAAGLDAYLQHPAHAELGARFGDSLAAALVFDFESVDLDSLRIATRSDGV